MTNQLQFEPVYKDRLFYDQYMYCISFKLNEASVLESPITHYGIDKVLDVRYIYRSQYLAWMHGQNLSDMKYDRLNLHLLADVLLQPNIDFKIITGHNKIWIYTNTIKLIDQIATLYFIVGPTYKQVFINRPRDTIRLKNSAYHQRTYFKSCTMTSTEKNNIIDFFTTHADNIRLSPRLKSFINHTNSHNYILDYFFVDYIDDYWLTLLMLKFPNIVRKTLKIVTA